MQGKDSPLVAMSDNQGIVMLIVLISECKQTNAPNQRHRNDLNKRALKDSGLGLG